MTILVLAALSILAGQAPAAPMSGTWKIAICKSEPCSVDDTASAHVHGFVVFSDGAVTLDMFPAETRRLLSTGVRPGAPANGCFALVRNTPALRTYAGIRQAGLIMWSAGAGGTEVRFPLYQSLDASHRVTARVSGGELRGTGVSSGARSAAPPSDWGGDIVVGRRVGPADIAPCVEAAK